MSSGIHAVTVYCSSSKSVDRVYFDAAAEMGRAIAAAGWTLVYGGNYIGCMASLADGARQGGARVVGVTPQLLVDKGIADTLCDELIVTSGMRERKGLMEQRGDAFVALPGGIGTLEEVIEVLVGRQLKSHSKPIVLLNVAGYYQPLLDLLADGMRRQFIRSGTDKLLFVTDRVDAAIEHLRRHAHASPPPPGAVTPPSMME